MNLLPWKCYPMFANSEIWKESNKNIFCLHAVDWSILVCYSQIIPWMWSGEHFVYPFVNCQGRIACCWWRCGCCALYLEFLFCQCACRTWSTGILSPTPVALQRIVSHSRVQTLFQNWALSSSLALLRLLVRAGSLSVFAKVPVLVPTLLLVALLFSLSPTPSLCFFFLSLLPFFGIALVYWLRVQHRCCVIPFFVRSLNLVGQMWI